MLTVRQQSLWHAVVSDRMSPQQNAVLGRDSQGKSSANNSTVSRYSSPPNWISLIARQAKLAQVLGWAKAVLLLLVLRKSGGEAVRVSLHGILSRYCIHQLQSGGMGKDIARRHVGQLAGHPLLLFPNCSLWWEDSKNQLHLTSFLVLQLTWFECPWRLSPPAHLTFVAQRHGHTEIEFTSCAHHLQPSQTALTQQLSSVPCHLWPTLSAAGVCSAFAASFQVTALALAAHSLHFQNLDTVWFRTATVSIRCWQPDSQLTAKRADPYPSQFLPHAPVCGNKKSSGIFPITIQDVVAALEKAFSSFLLLTNICSLPILTAA